MNRILVVSNNESSKKYLTQLIKSVGYEVYQCSGIIMEEVEAKIKAHDIDVVLLDFQKNEDVLLDLGKKLKRKYQCLVMALTQPNAEPLRKSGEIGIDDVLPKPLDLHQLKVTIELAQQVKSFHIARIDYLKKQEESNVKNEGKIRDLSEKIEMQQKELKILDDENMKKAYQIKGLIEENTQLILEMVDVIYQLAEYRDYKTHKHTIRVGVLSGMLARELGLEKTFVEDIELVAPLHDIGKIGIPDSILLKKGRLNEQEFEIMKKHAIYGYEILKNRSAHILKFAAEIALTHHERWNGSGYPKGLEGEQIPISAQIVGVADSFDAMVTDRPYKKAKSFEEAFGEIESLSGILYSPKVVEKFLKLRKDIEMYYLTHHRRYRSTHQTDNFEVS